MKKVETLILPPLCGGRIRVLVSGERSQIPSYPNQQCPPIGFSICGDEPVKELLCIRIFFIKRL
jgi:hypothetical protein